jgi:hypothetical protein
MIIKDDVAFLSPGGGQNEVGHKRDDGENQQNRREGVGERKSK